ncbi:MAG TPA: hypothetical protein VFG23_12335 [Polyangia bacterium]|nr:hypothetical protein [Polyangia bacterium]
MNSTLTAIVGGAFALATVAVIFAKPAAISDFFNGLSGVTKAAVSPVTG